MALSISYSDDNAHSQNLGTSSQSTDPGGQHDTLDEHGAPDDLMLPCPYNLRDRAKSRKICTCASGVDVEELCPDCAS